MPTAKDDLLSLADYAFRRLRDRIADLTDEEYFWEPAPGCWSVRPAGDGTWRVDASVPPPEPAPVTTIAWRLSHIIDLLRAGRNATWLGVAPIPAPNHRGAPETAATAAGRLDEAYAWFRRHVDAVDEATLSEPMGSVAGPYAQDSRRAFILHQLDELIHHGAEVGVLRDLYLATRPRDPFVGACLDADREAVESLLAADPGLRDGHPAIVATAAAAGRWDAVRLLVDLGFGVTGAEGVPPLHLAAGAGELEIVRMLVWHGADLGARDPRFDETPLGWARYFRQNEVADYLEGAPEPGPA
jgi:DinB superfamily/Ankyrin repeats (3 copies)